MSYSVTPGGGFTSTNLFSTDTTTGFPGGNLIDAAGATWITDGAAVGDGVSITGSTSNNGTYILVAINSETQIEVYPAITAEAAAGSVLLGRPNHTLVITDETTPTASSIVTAMASLDSRLFYRAAGFQNLYDAADPQSWDLFLHLFQNIEVTATSAITTTLVSNREIWFCYYDRRNNSGSGTNISTRGLIYNRTGSSGNFIMEVGSQSGGVESSRYGSVFVGAAPAVNQGDQDMALRMYHSCVIGGHGGGYPAGGSNISGETAEIGNVLSMGSFALVGAEPMTIKNLVIDAPVSPPTIFAATDLDAEDIKITRNDTTVFSTADLTVPGLTFLAGSTGPYVNIFVSYLDLLNMGRDIDIDSSNITVNSSTACVKRYSFDPTFVDEGDNPIENLYVTIEKIADAHYVQFGTGATGTWTITINGTAINFTGSASLTTLRSNAIAAINGSAEPVTATASTNNGQVGSSTGTILINSDVSDVTVDVVLTTAPGSGTWFLDPAPTGGTNAAQAPGDYQEEEYSGSPYTTTAAGKLNGTGGVDLMRAAMYETSSGGDPVHIRNKVTVEGAGYETTSFVVLLTSRFDGKFVVPYAKMGGLR